MVVSEDPAIDEKVLHMAFTMAPSATSRLAGWPSGTPAFSFSSSNRCSRKIEKSIVTPSCSTVASASVM